MFKKYLGDQKQIQKFNELRSLLNFRRDVSDDAISSNYANSSYSTMRDFTSSSISSTFGQSPPVMFEDSDGMWKDLDEAIKNGNKLTPVGSFERDDNGDFNKMQQFESLWNRREEPNPKPKFEPYMDLFNQKKLMENFYLSGKNRLDSDNSGNISESDHSFTYQRSMELGNISDSSPSTVISYSHKKSLSSIPVLIKQDQEQPERDVPDIGTMSSSVKSASSVGSYSKDYLALASKFGPVLGSLRKPGHHIGPIRNPQCPCETCKRWVLEHDKIQGRGRAFSFGDTPITRSTFWKKNNRYYV